MVEIDDWEVDDTEENEEDEPDVITYQINYYPADLTLKGYLDKDKSGQLVIPPFQRSYVWDQVKASKLIESFLLGLPVPNVFLYKVRNSNKLQVIDGQQRIVTAIRYFKNEFGENIFRLKNVNKRWEGKTYDQLAESDKFQLDDTVLRATVIQQLDPDDDSSMFHIFERLNTGGMNLNGMEIRKCVYSGPYFELLEELNSNTDWRRLIGQPKIDKRLRDTELLLRVLALSSRWEGYKKPMKRFLNDYFIAARKRDFVQQEDFIQTSRQAFIETCSFVSSRLKEKPFHLRGRLNYAALDSIMVASYLALNNHVENLSERYELLLSDKEYVTWCTSDTSDERVLLSRIARAIKTLAG
ncbi:MAG: DUF262 domain-containing protein [Chthonomonadales bacterium]